MPRRRSHVPHHPLRRAPPCSGRDLAGFCVGLGSICCWLVAQMPQLYRNYRSQSAEALSPWFLAEWLLVRVCVCVWWVVVGGVELGAVPGAVCWGATHAAYASCCRAPAALLIPPPPPLLLPQGDTCNLLGALLKGDQPTTVVLTAQYFIMVDAVMMVQYM